MALSLANLNEELVAGHETALFGSSECKTYCRRIIDLNRKRNQRTRLSKPVIASLEDSRVVIVSRNWKCCPLGLAAFTSATNVLLKEYFRLQAGFYLPDRVKGHGITCYLII